MKLVTFNTVITIIINIIIIFFFFSSLIIVDTCRTNQFSCHPFGCSKCLAWPNPFHQIHSFFFHGGWPRNKLEPPFHLFTLTTYYFLLSLFFFFFLYHSLPLLLVIFILSLLLCKFNQSNIWNLSCYSLPVIIQNLFHFLSFSPKIFLLI